MSVTAYVRGLLHTRTPQLSHYRTCAMKFYVNMMECSIAPVCSHLK